jgi:peptidoglycan/xylan/chitin deacetylase (PgdA/CDA1 family)
MKHKINLGFLLLGVFVTMLFFNNAPFFLPLLLFILVLYFLILSAGVLFLRFNYFLKSNSKVKPPYVLLSFDDGPHPVLTPKILETLKVHNVKAVFFVVGLKAEKYPEIIHQIVAEGHLVGNHTYTHHPLFAMYSMEKVHIEITKNAELLKNLTGSELQLFRPPIGYTNPKIARVVKKLGVKVIGWNVRSYDTIIQNPLKLKNRVLKLTKPGSIILFHDTLPQTEQMLDAYIIDAKQNGIIFANDSHLNLL